MVENLNLKGDLILIKSMLPREICQNPCHWVSKGNEVDLISKPLNM